MLVVQPQILNFMRFSPRKIRSAKSSQKFNFRELLFSVKNAYLLFFAGNLDNKLQNTFKEFSKTNENILVEKGTFFLYNRET